MEESELRMRYILISAVISKVLLIFSKILNDEPEALIALQPELTKFLVKYEYLPITFPSSEEPLATAISKGLKQYLETLALKLSKDEFYASDKEIIIDSKYAEQKNLSLLKCQNAWKRINNTIEEYISLV